MDIVVALHAAAALLLLIAGSAKLVRPEPTVDLLVSLGLSNRTAPAVAIGLGEIAGGLAALAIGGPLPAAATGLFYVVFAAVVGRAMAEGAASCGCFGRTDVPPSWIHVVGNIAFAALSFVAVVGDTPVDAMDGQPAGGVGFVLFVGVVAGLALVAFTALPEALRARRGASTGREFRLGSGRERR